MNTTPQRRRAHPHTAVVRGHNLSPHRVIRVRLDGDQPNVDHQAVSAFAAEGNRGQDTGRQSRPANGGTICTRAFWSSLPRSLSVAAHMHRL